MCSRRPGGGLEGIAVRVGEAASTSMILEALVTPKPGNVHRLSDLPGLTLEDFAVSALISHRYFVEAARIGLRMFVENTYADGSLGGVVRDCVVSVTETLGTNVNLGTALTLTLQSASSAYVLAECGRFDVDRMVEIAYRIARSTGTLDTKLYLNSVRLASPSYLGRIDFWGVPDVHDPLLANKVTCRGLKLHRVLASISSDIVSKNFASGLILTRMYYLKFKEELASLGWDNALLRIFARIIVENGDYLVLRRSGVDGLGEVRELMRQVLESKDTSVPLRLLFRLDREFRAKGYNPGSSADIVASIIMCYLLEEPLNPWRSRRPYYWNVPSPEDCDGHRHEDCQG